MPVLKALQSGHWPSLLAAWLHFEVSFMTWVLLGALGVFIAQDLEMTSTQKGFMVAVPLLSGALGRVGVGICADWVGPRRTGLGSMLIVGVPLTWAWLAVSTFPQLVLLGVFLGVAGTSFAVSLPLASRAYPLAHQGLAMGVAGSGNSGAILSLALAPLIAERMGWHAVFGLMIPVVVLTAAVYGVLARDHHLFNQGAAIRRDLRFLLREADMYWFCLLYSVTFGGFVGLSSYLSIFFFDQYLLSRVEAGWAAAACAFAGSLSRPIGGHLADHYGGLRVLSVLLASIAFMTGMAAFLLPLAFMLGCILLMMVGLGLANGVIFQVVPLWFRGEIGKVSGLIGAAGGIGGFFLPAMLGMLRDFNGTYRTGFTIFAVLCVLVLPVVRRLGYRSFRTGHDSERSREV